MERTNIKLQELRESTKGLSAVAHTYLVQAIYNYACALVQALPHIGDVEDTDLEENWEEIGLGDCSIRVLRAALSPARVVAVIPHWDDFTHSCGVGGTCDCSPKDLHIDLLNKTEVQEHLNLSVCPAFLQKLDKKVQDVLSWAQHEKARRSPASKEELLEEVYKLSASQIGLDLMLRIGNALGRPSCSRCHHRAHGDGEDFCGESPSTLGTGVSGVQCGCTHKGGKEGSGTTE